MTSVHSHEPFPYRLLWYDPFREVSDDASFHKMTLLFLIDNRHLPSLPFLHPSIVLLLRKVPIEQYI